MVSINIDSLRNVVEQLRNVVGQVSNMLSTKGKVVAFSTESIIDKGRTFLSECRSLAVKNTKQRSVTSKTQDKTSPFLNFKGNFQLNPTNVASFSESLKNNGAKFIVKKLTDKEIFGLINSEFLSIPQKSQICKAYEGRNKASLEDRFATQLTKKLASLNFNEGAIAKFFEVLPDPQKFANYMLDIFANTSLDNLSGVLEFYFGFAGIFPLQDLSKEHLEAFSKALSGIEIGNLIPSSGNINTETLTEAGKKMVQLLGLKYALEVALGERNIEEVKSETIVVKNCIKDGQASHLLKSGNYSDYVKKCISFLNNINPKEPKDIFDNIEYTFDYLTSEARPTEVVIFQILKEAIDDGKTLKSSNIESIDVEKLCEKWVSEMESSDIKTREEGILDFIKFSMENKLDPTPILSLYPKTTLEVFREMFEGVRYRDSQQSPEEFFERINILIEIGSRAKDIFPLPQTSKDFSDAEAYQHFLGNFQTLLDKLREFRDKYDNPSSGEGKVYEDASAWARTQAGALQGAIRTFESLCEDAQRTV